MIVQARSDRFRLVRQHDHALAAGELAHSWRTASGALPLRLVAAVALHDVAWRELDRRPRSDPETGRPHAFDTYPLAPKLRAYASGLDEMEDVDPWIGLLGSLHYSSFLDDDAAPRFLAAERERRERLRELLRERWTRRGPTPEGGRAGGRPGGDDGNAGAVSGGRESGVAADRGVGRRPPAEAAGRRLRRHLRWLKFFDGLSLRLCLAPPGVRDDALPEWLDRGAPVTPPEGDATVPRWSDEGRVELDPAPLAGPVTLELPYRDLARRSYPDAETLEAAWGEAQERVWRLRVVGAP